MDFWFPSACKSYVYTMLWSIKCVTASHLKKTNIHTLIKNTLLLKNATHHLSLHQVVPFLPMEGLALKLMAAD